MFSNCRNAKLQGVEQKHIFHKNEKHTDIEGLRLRKYQWRCEFLFLLVMIS